MITLSSFYCMWFYSNIYVITILLGHIGGFWQHTNVSQQPVWETLIKIFVCMSLYICLYPLSLSPKPNLRYPACWPAGPHSLAFKLLSSCYEILVGLPGFAQDFFCQLCFFVCMSLYISVFTLFLSLPNLTLDILPADLPVHLSISLTPSLSLSHPSLSLYR